MAREGLHRTASSERRCPARWWPTTVCNVATREVRFKTLSAPRARSLPAARANVARQSHDERLCGQSGSQHRHTLLDGAAGGVDDQVLTRPRTIIAVEHVLPRQRLESGEIAESFLDTTPVLSRIGALD